MDVGFDGEGGEGEAWRRARALAALGSGERVARWLVGALPCPDPPRGWEAALRNRGLTPWVPPEGGGPVLLVAGETPGAGVGVVGARAADAYGLAVARRVAVDVVALGFAVVSGGAEGCDAAAHTGALDAGGATTVVLGGGHDRPYPAAHKGLFQRVRENGGAVVSAYWPTTPVARHRFVARNAVIAGLSRAVVVVRARARSGALVTAGAAAALGRPVLAVPGDVGEGLSVGVHGLLERGAVALVSPRVLFRVLGGVGPGSWSWPVQHQGSGAPWSEIAGPACEGDRGEVGPWGQAVLEALGLESGLDLDAMVVRTELPVDAVASALLDLELVGLVRRLPGDRYARAEGGAVVPSGSRER